MKNNTTSNARSLRTASRALVLSSLAMVVWTGTAFAQLPIPVSSQFDITGFLQKATLDSSCAGNAHCGGTLTVNNHLVTVPKEIIVILPANQLTWQELFAQAPAPYGPGATGLAQTDVPTPAYPYEVHVVGNRVTTAAGGDQYIAGLISISQQSLNSGAGFINFMDYTKGEMRVGGTLGDSTTGARVQLNDPKGRYGRAMSPDPRFTVDPDNPTITAGTGYPMCFPRSSPPPVGGAETDAACPQGNRPLGATGPVTLFTMAVPYAAGTTGPMDPTLQAPFEVGDYITYGGTLFTDAAGTYISAHTIEDNVAIFTVPGVDPAYVRIDVSLLGTGGLTVLGAGEAVIRTRFEGMSTDPSRLINLYGLDFSTSTPGAWTERLWGTIGVDPGPPSGAVKGRWRFRPPCTATTATDKACVMNPLGVFLPATQEVMARIAGATNPLVSNGLLAGMYHAPIAELIFPENIPGTPIVPNNFETIPFLAQGGYVSTAGTMAGQLNPWPGASAPAPACSAPTAIAGGPYTVASSGTVLLAGSGAGTGPFSFLWAAPSGSFSNAAVANPIFTAPVGPATVSLSLTVTNACGTNTASGTVTVSAPVSTPTVNAVAPQTVSTGTPVTLTATGTPAGLTFTWTQTSGTPVALVPTAGTNGATVGFLAPVLPLGTITPVVLTFSVTATDGTSVSPAVTATVTVNPLPDSVIITLSEYRTSKQRLVINATSSVISPNVVLTLQPYLTTSGVIFDPSVLGNVFTNNGGGLYILTLVGAPEPAVPPATPLVVKSNLGGVSAPTALQRIRL